MNTSSQQINEKKFFNLHTTGLGYLNRIRTIKPKKSSPFLACTIAALVGSSDELEYRYFDVKVSGEKAINLIQACEKAVNASKKVLIGFKLGDLWTDVFTYTKGKKQGETGVQLKGRLFSISLIKIDNKMIYTANSDEQETLTSEIEEPDVLDEFDVSEDVFNL